MIAFEEVENVDWNDHMSHLLAVVVWVGAVAEGQ